jgi:S1-C subfamily serine protease
MTRILSLIVALLFAAPALAAWPWDAVCDITNLKKDWDRESGRWINHGGSGTLVGVSNDTGLILSCAHLWENGGKTAEVKFLSIKQPFRGQVLAVDHQNDLSAISITAPKGIATPKAVRAARPEDGVLVAAGFPFYSKGELHWTSGKFLNYSGSDLHFAARPYVHSGFSGGAVFAMDGSLVGVVSGYDYNAGVNRGWSIAPSGQALEKFASRFMKAGAK